MKIRDLKLEPVLSTTLDESIAEAADRMRFYEIGSLAVLEHGGVAGILTERDVVRAVADRSDVQHLTVRFYVTSAPTTVAADADVEEAASLMLSLGVRHLPVVDGMKPIGMVSIRDILSAQLELTAEVL